jgi:hypothetical protein
MRYFQAIIMGFLLVASMVLAQAPAQAPVPTAYTITHSTRMTEVSMFSGQVSNLKVYRKGSKELVDLTIAPYAANPDGSHLRYLFDFQAHKAYSQEVTSNACSWMNYVSARAPVFYDPITAMDDAMRAQFAEARKNSTVKEAVNGIPAIVIESAGQDAKMKMWLAEKGDYPVKMVRQPANGPAMTMLEVQQVDFTPPADSFFVPPANCDTHVDGEWSDSGLRAHASTTIKGNASGSVDLKTDKKH